MVLVGAIPFNSQREKNNIIQDLLKEFNNRVKFEVDNVNKIVNYHKFMRANEVTTLI